MALVNYTDSSSSSEQSDEDDNYLKTKRFKMYPSRLPLPKEIVNMNGKEIDDQPEDRSGEHDGRTRTFKHERGNWATYVYIPVNLYAMEELQNLFLEALNLEISLKKTDDVHISLTKTVVLRHHWIDSFISSVQKDLEQRDKFLIDLTKVCVYCNEERTRTFIALQVDALHCSKLQSLVHGLDDILEDYRLGKFYEDPSFHASILWCIEDHQEVIKQQISKLQKIMDDFCVRNNIHLQINVKKICCKTGNKKFIFELNK